MGNKVEHHQTADYLDSTKEAVGSDRRRRGVDLNILDHVRGDHDHDGDDGACTVKNPC